MHHWVKYCVHEIWSYRANKLLTDAQTDRCMDTQHFYPIVPQVDGLAMAGDNKIYYNTDLVVWMDYACHAMDYSGGP